MIWKVKIEDEELDVPLECKAKYDEYETLSYITNMTVKKFVHYTSSIVQVDKQRDKTNVSVLQKSYSLSKR